MELRPAVLGLALALTLAGTGTAAFARDGAQTLQVTQKDTQALKEALAGHKVQPVQDKEAQMDISVGAEVPATVTLHPVPLEVVEAAPAFQAHDFFILTDGRIVIVDPATLRIVRIIRA